MPGTVQLTAQNVVVPGDLMAIWADASTLLLQRVQIYTTFEKRSIQMSAHYEQLLGGPVVPVRIQVSYPAEKIEAQITNAAFKPAGPPTAAATTASAGRPGIGESAGGAGRSRSWLAAAVQQTRAGRCSRSSRRWTSGKTSKRSRGAWRSP